ncbi:MAG: GspH/FimT family pseudopilin [Gammaproteobacteria bacterium]|nr:GspH/FimT family pseudopilin [Gammaproteobacteria bacterium]
MDITAGSNQAMDSRARGVSLAELLVVLGIISLLTVVSFPVVDTAGAEASQFNMIMMRSLGLARRQAVGGGERVTLCASDDGRSCLRDWVGNVSILVFTDRNRDHRLDDGDLLHHSQRLVLRQGRGYWRGSLGRRYMRFRVDGSAVEYGRYTYCPHSGDSRHFRQLVVNRVGRAYRHHDGGGKRDDCG